jgi:ABC-type glycerol-3-phosphate transport system substrate-binding protein
MQTKKSIVMWKVYILPFIVLLSSCSNSDKSYNDVKTNTKNTSIANVKTLNIIGHWLNEGKRENLVRELANEFEFLNQEYRVNLVFPEQIYWTRTDPNCEAKYLKKVLTSDTSNWDVIRINNEYYTVANYMNDPDWAKKYLVDFSEIPEFKAHTNPDLLTKANKDFWNGIIPGPYLEGYNWSLWYNRELAKEIGLEVKQFGMTANDLIQYVKVVTEYNKRNNSQIMPLLDCSDWSTTYVLALQLYISEVGDVNEINSDSYNEKKLEAWHKALKVCEELSKNKAINYDIQSMKFNTTWNYPLTKKCLFYLNASWMYNIWKKQDSKLVNDMVPVELPTFRQPNLYFGGYMITWAVPKNAPHKEEAIKFLLYLNQPDMAEKWARYTKCPTGIAGGVTSSAIGTNQFEEYNDGINKKYGSKKVNFIDDSRIIFGNTRRQVKNLSKEVIGGTITADEAMVEIRKQLRNFKH